MHPALARPMRRHLGNTPVAENIQAVLEAASCALFDLERDREVTARTMDELSHELEERLEGVRASEQRYRLLFDSGPYATFVLRRSDRVVLDWNAAAARILGWTRVELQGRTMDTLGMCGIGCALAGKIAGSDPIDAQDVLRTTLTTRSGTFVEAEVQGLDMMLGDIAAALIIVRDVTALNHAEQSARDSASRFSAFFDHTGIAIQVLTANGTITEANPACRDMLGYEIDELIGTDIAALMGVREGEQATAYWPVACAEVMSAARASLSLEMPFRHRNGGTVWGQLTLARVQRGEDARLMAMLQDVTERKRMELELERQAFRDDLTGLANRVLFRDRLRHALLRRQRNGDSVAVLLLDLDGFKRVNDSLGHAAGDALLRVIGERIVTAVRIGETVARLGGDEFAIVTENTDARESQLLAERLLLSIAAPVQIAEREVVVSVSIGIASALSGEDEEAVLRNADTAMYSAKSQGKQCIRQFDPSMHALALVWLEIEQDLRRALVNKEFVLHFQPLMHLHSGKLSGFEALVRWNHPRRGLVSPSEFLHVAEETGLVVGIGSWVLHEACRRAVEWSDARGEGFPSVSVNLAPRQLDQPDLLDEVQSALDATGLDPHRLILEITESEVMRDPENARRKLQALRELGVRVAIDDFGTGYSSLSHLQYFPVDEMKIDQSFVARLGDGEREATFVRTMVSLAKSLGVEIVAEGIELPAQHEVLAKLGCDLGQGYLFSRPMNESALTAFLAKRDSDAAEYVWRAPSVQDSPLQLLSA